MSSNYVDCPDGGKCGHYRHRLRSNAYQWCMKKAITRGSNSGQVNSSAVTKPPERRSHVMKSVDQVMMALRKGKSRYFELPRYFVTDDMKIGESAIQSYLDTGRTDGLIKSEWESQIKASIRSNLVEEVSEDVDLSGLSDSKIDDLVDAVFDDNKTDIVMAIASIQKPRTFIHDVDWWSHDSKAEEALKEANAKHDVGSDEWYNTLAEGYHEDLMYRDLTYTAAMSEREMEEDRRAIASALKESLEYVDLDDLVLPEMSIVWTGSLGDVAPNDSEPESEIVRVFSPYFVFMYDYEGIAPICTPVKLNGAYRIKIRDREDRVDYGVASGIRDDMSAHGNARYFDYPNNAGLDQFKPEKVVRSYD